MGADERTRTSSRCAHETRVPPRVVSVAGVGIEPTDSERMKLVSHRCSIPAVSSPGVEPGAAAFGEPRSSDDEELWRSRFTAPSRRRVAEPEGRRLRCARPLRPRRTSISRRSRTSRAGFVDLLPTVGGDAASHGGIEPSVVGSRIQRSRPLDECDMALPARVDRAALRLEDAGPGRGRKHSEARRGVEPRSTILQIVSLPEQRAVGADGGNRTRMNVLGKHVPHQSASPASERSPGIEPGSLRWKRSRSP